MTLQAVERRTCTKEERPAPGDGQGPTPSLLRTAHPSLATPAPHTQVARPESPKAGGPREH